MKTVIQNIKFNIIELLFKNYFSYSFSWKYVQSFLCIPLFVQYCFNLMEATIFFFSDILRPLTVISHDISVFHFSECFANQVYPGYTIFFQDILRMFSSFIPSRAFLNQFVLIFLFMK